MYSLDLKNKAQRLRRQGHGIREIAKLLNLNPTTISFWCRDIQLSQELIDKIKNSGKKKSKEGLLKYGEKIRNERIARTLCEKKLGANLVGQISPRDVLMVGLGLYWGEGYKESNSELGFTNSNPAVIRFYLKWLSHLGVKKEDLIFRLTVNEVYRSYESDISLFWIKDLQVGEGQFSKTTFIKTNLKKAFIPDVLKYHGILRVKVRRGLKLKNTILGGIGAFAE